MAAHDKNRQHKELHGGIIVSHGIALGKALVIASDTPYVPNYSIMKNQVGQELNRLEVAIKKTQDDIREIKASVDSELLQENLKYLDAHLLILNDPILHTQIKDDINKKLLNIETVFCNAIENLIEKMGMIDDEYLRDRAYDLRDIHKRVLLNLLGKEQVDLRNLSEDVVVISYNISPSQTAGMDKDHVKGLITEIGGKTSHSAILARALEIPALVGVHEIRNEIQPGDYVILDANHGHIIINPKEKILKQYQTAKHVFDRFLKKLAFLNQVPAKSTDNELFLLFANIEIPEEIPSVKGHGADGIGLFRSEFIFLDKKQFPSEEEQLQIYGDVLEKLKNLPVVIRTMDLGGDKLSTEHRMYHEANPFLGWRSLRFCLSKPELFKKQLRALYRASVKGDLRIMLPMISGLDELMQSKAIIEEAKAELVEKGLPFNKDLKIGIMMEIPAAVMIADELAKHVDFFSIGTNDLIQYTIAVDRGNERISYLYKALHPSVLKLIKMTIEAGNRAGIPVEMCGEMAGNPLYTVLLMGMGLKLLSMSSSFIPEVKKIIRSTSTEDAKQFASEIFEMHRVDEIEEKVITYMREHFPGIFDKTMF